MEESLNRDSVLIDILERILADWPFLIVILVAIAFLAAFAFACFLLMKLTRIVLVSEKWKFVFSFEETLKDICEFCRKAECRGECLEDFPKTAK